MIKKVLLFVVLISAVQISAQSDMTKLSAKVINAVNSGAQSLDVWIDLTDKGNETAYLMANPDLYLTQKSIERRKKYGIAINYTDLPLNDSYVSALEEKGAVIRKKSKWLNAVSASIKVSDLSRFTSLSFVKKIDLIAKMKSDKPKSFEEPLPELSKSGNTGNPVPQYNLNYGESLAQLEISQIPAVHDLGYAGQGITIAMMDAGFNKLSHEVFDSMNVAHTWDFVNNDPDVGDGGMGNGTHGTYTLSAIGSYKQGILVGPAYRSTYLLAKTENTDSETPIEEDNWIAAAEWADSLGADITSTSLVYLDFDPPYVSYTWQDMDGNTPRITRGADLAVSKGIAVFNSAGNYGFNSDHNTIAAPADGDSVITIGSVTIDGLRSGFSSVGNTVDGRTKPDLMARGSSVISASPSSNSSYTYTSGTSLSCPIAAGAGALLLQARPHLTPIQLRDALKANATNSNTPNREYGWGIIKLLDAINNTPSSNKDEEPAAPGTFVLKGNYPNPFNPSTRIRFEVGVTADLKLEVYNTSGELIAVLANQTFSAGVYEYNFNAQGLSSGVYLVRLSNLTENKMLKITLLK